MELHSSSSTRHSVLFILVFRGTARSELLRRRNSFIQITLMARAPLLLYIHTSRKTSTRYIHIFFSFSLCFRLFSVAAPSRQAGPISFGNYVTFTSNKFVECISGVRKLLEFNLTNDVDCWKTFKLVRRRLYMLSKRIPCSFFICGFSEHLVRNFSLMNKFNRNQWFFFNLMELMYANPNITILDIMLSYY